MLSRVLFAGALTALASGCSPARDAHAPAPEAAPAPAPSVAPTWAQPGWRTDRVLVSIPNPAQAVAIAESHGLSLPRPVTEEGLAALALPAGTSVEDALLRLSRDERVAHARPIGMLHAASLGDRLDAGSAPHPEGPAPTACDRSGPVAALQWHLNAAGVASGGAPPHLGDVVVAVIDSGVAYEDHETADGRRFVQAPSLEGVRFVAPADFVEGDGHPNDDNGHGTHVTSLIASSGAVCGVAPGVSIMPIKVLAADNTGDELALIEALRHARRQGADLVHMSLSFGPGYVPSPELRAELGAAYDADLPMVASAGNTGAARVTWPAASAHVLAVAASTLSGASDDGPPALQIAAYSNRSGEVNLVAPGGDLTADRDGDGHVDGILAETIDPEDPTRVGYWYLAGTSQAAALVTGAAARIAAAEGDDYAVAGAIMASAAPLAGLDPIAEGVGTGALDVDAAWAAWTVDGAKAYKRYVAVVPWLAPVGGGEARLRARVSAVNRRGEPVEDGAVVHATLRGATQERRSCALVDGQCVLQGSAVPREGADGQPAPLAWSVSVDALERGGSLVPPATSLGVTRELEAVVGAMQSSTELAGEALALHWADGDDPQVGPVAESFALLDLEAGVCVSPHAALANAAFLEQMGGSVEDLLSLGFDDTGDAGDATTTTWTLSGSGLATSPMGLRPLRFAAVEGAALARPKHDGLGVVALTSLDPGVAPVPTTDGQALGGAFEPVWVPSVLEANGWTADGGYGAAELFVELGGLAPAAGATTGAGARGRLELGR